MVKLSDLLVDKSLNGLGTDQRHVIRSVTSLIFMASFITYDIVTLTIDGITSFLQVLDVKNVRSNTLFSLNNSCGIF